MDTVLYSLKTFFDDADSTCKALMPQFVPFPMLIETTQDMNLEISRGACRLPAKKEV